jgi:hypothetical protein
MLAIACSGSPEVVQSDGSGATNAGTDPNGKGGIANGGRGGTGVNVGDGGDKGDAGGPGTGCKTTCEPGECGPIADGCGDVVECGGCTAPETCGGGGEPSRCGGDSGCTPKTCDDIGADCGLQPDGCGGVVDCWATKAKECADPVQACIDGTCTDTTSCTKLTCKAYSKDEGLCGPVSDGCGGTLDCGLDCATGEFCGVKEPGKCGVAVCEPQTCEAVLKGKPAGYCGFVADGCGGEIKNCAVPCTGADTCGGGGTADVCGHGSTVCVPNKTAADCGNSCDPISDGCGNVIQCKACTGTDTCGGGGVAGVCGSPACVPRTCSQLNAECGSIPNGCGGTLANCGTCASDEICNANVCQKVKCVPKTSAEVCPGKCGPVSDGCSSTINCGGCTGNNTCGGGGTESVCGSPPCTPLTCQALGATCGPIGDGCGGVAQCGSCPSGQTCGGGGASKCGVLVDPNCTGLCPNVKTCAAGSETRLSGTVYAPNGTEPLYNALVYVPNAPLPAIPVGPSCGRCEDENLGSPLAAALTGADGKFVLKNVPAGVSFPLVVKMGKWRRVVTIPAVTQCTNVNLTVDQTRLPRNMSNDAAAGNVQYLNIPKTAMVTGSVDEMECVLRKIGIDDSEFTLPSGTGRIHLYRANGAHASSTRTCVEYRSNGSCRRYQTDYQDAPIDDLFAGTTIDKYDLGIFDCEGSANEHNNTFDAKLKSFADRGGRVFASHYSYVYLHDNGDFANTATWGGAQQGNGDATTGILDTSFAKGTAFNAWLGNVNAWDATYGSGYIHIDDPRGYVKTVTSASERFVYTDTSRMVGTPAVQINQQSAIQQYSFNTPVAASAANICGRVLYTGFHVANASGNGGQVFPEHCSTGPLTPQEKVLEFMIFDLSACVSVGDPPPPPSCKKKTCAGVGATCGPVADGCGGLLQCGTCTPPASCGGGGVANQCGSVCKQTSCGAKGANCGVIADGCGGTLTCGVCTPPAVCGGGGTANVCGVPQCQPRSCASVGATCGPISDGCGGTVNCGSCPSGQTCGGGGTPNVCGTGTCNPKTCANDSAQCGFIGDGCGGTIACGMCMAGQTCGAAGPNKCGGSCTPRTCAAAGAECGFVGDGCGGVLNCGVCMAPAICGGGGTPSKCGGSCTPRTCTQAGATCGGISDGCGGVLQCGVCPAGQVCGGGGVPNQCGAGSCTPKTCDAAGAECGPIGDGCGGIVDCGMCVAPLSCGGAGAPNKCGMGTGGCTPRTCAQQNADCGPVADGCGNLLDCGVCAPGLTCGGGGVASKCGGIF